MFLTKKAAAALYSSAALVGLGSASAGVGGVAAGRLSFLQKKHKRHEHAHAVRPDPADVAAVNGAALCGPLRREDPQWCEIHGPNFLGSGNWAFNENPRVDPATAKALHYPSRASGAKKFSGDGDQRWRHATGLARACCTKRKQEQKPLPTSKKGPRPPVQADTPARDPTPAELGRELCANLKKRVETWCYEAGSALELGNWGPKVDPHCDEDTYRAIHLQKDDFARGKAIFYICCAKSDNQGNAPAKVLPPAPATPSEKPTPAEKPTPTEKPPTVEQVKAVTNSATRGLGDMKEKEDDSSCK